MDDWHDTLAVLEDSIGTYCVPMTGEHAKSVAKMPAHIKQALDNGGEALLNIADRLEPGLRLQWLSAAVDVRNTADLERIAEAFMSGHMTELEAAAALQDLQNMGDNIDPILKQGFLQGATAAAELIGLSEAQVSLSLVNEAAVNWASTRAAEMVTVSTDSAKDLIRLVVANGIERGDHPSVVARLIRDVVGLNAQQGEAVDAFYQDMLDRGLSEEDALARTDKYSVAKLRERATMIARTEAITALNKGQEAYWQQAEMKGFLNPDVTRRVWIASDDDKTCEDTCLPLDGEETTLDEPWTIPDGPNQGEEIDSPGMDAHPHCRCTEGLVFHRDTADENATDEDVTPADEVHDDEEAGIGQVIAKYNPDQPRVPAGSHDGGEWGGGTGSVPYHYQAGDVYTNQAGEMAFRSPSIAEQVLESSDIGIGSVIVADNGSTLRAAVVAADTLRTMKAQGYTMPSELHIEQNPSRFSSMSGETDELGVVSLLLPSDLPKETSLDAMTKVAFAGSSSKGIQNFVARSFQDVIVHEMGHLQAFKWSGPHEFSEAAAANFHHMQDAIRQVSTYAARNANEFIAEAFTMQYKGGSLKPQAAELYKILNGPKVL